MADTNELTAAIAELDDGYLQAQLLLSVGRAGRDEPRRAAYWHALAGLLAEEQQRRRQGVELTGESDGDAAEMTATLDHVREELRLDAETLEARWLDATGGFPTPAGQAPPIASVDEATSPGTA